jgi:hypothetical protein
MMRLHIGRIRRQALALAAVAAVVLGLAMLPAPTATAGKTNETEGCNMDPVTQSVCIYRLILDDIDSAYPMRGGGGISSISQQSSTGFTATLAQEGHEDLRHYEIAIGDDGTPAIAAVTTETHSR